MSCFFINWLISKLFLFLRLSMRESWHLEQRKETDCSQRYLSVERVAMFWQKTLTDNIGSKSKPILVSMRGELHVRSAWKIRDQKKQKILPRWQFQKQSSGKVHVFHVGMYANSGSIKTIMKKEMFCFFELNWSIALTINFGHNNGSTVNKSKNKLKGIITVHGRARGRVK